MQDFHATTLVEADAGIVFARNPQWIDGRLLFLDIHERCIKSTNSSGIVRAEKSVSFFPGCLQALEQGGLVVDLSAVTGTWLSDAVCDSRGGMYIADVGFDFLNPSVEPLPQGLIVYLNSAGDSSVVAAELFSPQSMIITPDKNTLLFLCTSASNDPVITRRTPNASIEVFEVSIPGPACKQLNAS